MRPPHDALDTAYAMHTIAFGATEVNSTDPKIPKDTPLGVMCRQMNTLPLPD
jgi:hypothetical protein